MSPRPAHSALTNPANARASRGELRARAQDVEQRAAAAQERRAAEAEACAAANARRAEQGGAQ